MKQKISYLFFSFILVLLAISTIGTKQAEAAQNTSWATAASGNGQTENLFTNDYLSGVQEKLSTGSTVAPRFFAPVSCGGIQVIKYDGRTNARLSGAQFTIYDRYNRVVQVIQTNYNGIAETRSLPIGSYSIRETKAPNGYQLETSAMYFNISFSGQFICLTKCNTQLPPTVSKGTLKVIKTNENNQALAGAVFDVYNSNNQFVGRITTDATGTAFLSGLPYGTYMLIEVQAPAGHQLDTTPRYVTISSASPNGITSISILNKKVITTGALQVIKQDETGKRLAGAEFEVRNANGVVVGRITTDANGVATLGNLPFGTYQLIETKAPEGYELDTTPRYVTVSKTDPNGKVSITVLNKEKVATGSLEVIKEDESGKQRLAGAEFEVRDANGKVVGNITTDENGMATLKDLPRGTYQLIETKAPEGYELDATPKTVVISKDDPNGVVSITITNKLEKTTGDLEVVKKDEAGTLLAGAEFDVYNSNDQLVGKITTDANGIGQLTDLPYGTYKLIETKAPEGYELDTTPRFITLSKTDPNGKASIEIVNKKIELPATGSLKVIKYVKDSDPIVYLPGAVFEVYDGDTNLIGTYTTDSNGEILLTDLEPGKYYVIEIEAPPGYEQDTTFYEVTVESGKVAEVRHANVKKENLGGLKITKYAKDEDGFETTNVLPNAEFEVTDSAGNVHKGTTDTQGELFFPGLPAGEVTITETKAPDGYEIDAAVQTKTIVAETITEAVFYNKPKQDQGRALVYLSSNDAKQVLKGLEYNIVCTKGAAFETTVVTNAFGQISIYLLPGEYTIEPAEKGRTTTKPTSFKIEANKFTIIKLVI
ncbi:SpaA isopeptide-forming pilin-related protein [Enterococcus crotali]